MGQGADLHPRSLEERAPRSLGPWSPDHLVRLLVANVIGLVFVAVGWWTAAGQGSTRHQLAWLNLSLLGLVAAGGANGLWVARGRRVVTLARATVLPAPPGAGPWPAKIPCGHNGSAAAGGKAVGQSGGLVASSAMSRFH